MAEHPSEGIDGRERGVRVRTIVIAALSAFSSLVLLVPQAHAAGQACYSVQVAVNGEDVVNHKRAIRRAIAARDVRLADEVDARIDARSHPAGQIAHPEIE